MKVAIFGDSITADGAWIDSINSMEQDKFEMINLGRNGRTASQIPNEIPKFLRRKQSNGSDVFVIFLGINDLPHHGDETVSKIMENINDGIVRAKRHYGNNVILISPCNVNSKMLSEASPKYHVYKNLEPLVKELDNKYKLLAKEHEILFISMLKVVGKKNYWDGLHPNKKGHDEISKAVWKKIKNHKFSQ